MPNGEKEQRKGAKLTRSETVTVRIDPRLKYGAELAARRQRRTLSSFIEWAIDKALREVHVLDQGAEGTATFHDLIFGLYDVDESDRFVGLAFNYPDLLTHDEQVRWKLIKENGTFWVGKTDSLGNHIWSVKYENIKLSELRLAWAKLQDEASARALLAEWEKYSNPACDLLRE